MTHIVIKNIKYWKIWVKYDGYGARGSFKIKNRSKKSTFIMKNNKSMMYMDKCFDLYKACSVENCDNL